MDHCSLCVLGISRYHQLCRWYLGPTHEHDACVVAVVCMRWLHVCIVRVHVRCVRCVRVTCVTCVTCVCVCVCVVCNVCVMCVVLCVCVYVWRVCMLKYIRLSLIHIRMYVCMYVRMYVRTWTTYLHFYDRQHGMGMRPPCLLHQCRLSVVWDTPYSC